MELKFRTLKANEIDVRVSTVGAKGVSFLLYKDARVDMAILDETVGPMNWQRNHSRDNANCTISIWDDDKKLWVSKEDTGVESNTAKEKGLASDSFKRAGTNWGIGRELYTAPFIFVSCETVKNEGGKGYQQKNKYEFLDAKVTEIEYNEDREITHLAIAHAETGEVFYVFPKGKSKAKKGTKEEPKAEASSVKSPLPVQKVTEIRDKAELAGVSINTLCDAYKVDTIVQLTEEQYENCIKRLEATIKKGHSNE